MHIDPGRVEDATVTLLNIGVRLLEGMKTHVHIGFLILNRKPISKIPGTDFGTILYVVWLTS